MSRLHNILSGHPQLISHSTPHTAASKSSQDIIWMHFVRCALPASQGWLHARLLKERSKRRLKRFLSTIQFNPAHTKHAMMCRSPPADWTADDLVGWSDVIDRSPSPPPSSSSSWWTCRLCALHSLLRKLFCVCVLLMCRRRCVLVWDVNKYGNVIMINWK